MKNNSPLPEEKKLTVVVRVEPGCLGPKGNNHVEEFCRVAHIEIEKIDTNLVNWEVTPRFDKSFPEIQYKASNKILTLAQATKYLKLFDKNLDEFEELINEKLTVLIDHHLGR